MSETLYEHFMSLVLAAGTVTLAEGFAAYMVAVTVPQVVRSKNETEKLAGENAVVSVFNWLTERFSHSTSIV